MTTTEQKACARCGETKAVAEFARLGSNRPPIYCKPCKAQHDREYRERHKGEISARRRDRRAAGGAARQREYRERNKERTKQREREYRERNKARIQAWRRQVWAARGDELREKNRRYSKSRPMENKARVHRRRAKKCGAGGSYTSAEWAALCQHFGNVCLSCGSSELTVDHVIPLTKGGRNDVANLQPLCQSCNRRKGQKDTDYRNAGKLRKFLAKNRKKT